MEKTFEVNQNVPVKQQLSDIVLDVSMARISLRYFDKSRSWLYHKLDGIDGNGKATDFSLEEKEQLRGALEDLSKRILTCAEKL